MFTSSFLRKHETPPPSSTPIEENTLLHLRECSSFLPGNTSIAAACPAKIKNNSLAAGTTAKSDFTDCLRCIKHNETAGGAKGPLNVPVSMEQDSGPTSTQTSSSIILMGQTELNSNPNFTFYPVRRLFLSLFLGRGGAAFKKRGAHGGRDDK